MSEITHETTPDAARYLFLTRGILSRCPDFNMQNRFDASLAGAFNVHNAAAS